MKLLVLSTPPPWTVMGRGWRKGLTAAVWHDTVNSVPIPYSPCHSPTTSDFTVRRWWS